MLEIICAGYLTLSINVCQNNELSLLTMTKKVEVLNIIKQDLALDRNYLAEIIANESEYRREADRERERHEINAPDENREDRVYRDADQHRRESESDDRVYRDADQHRRESESDDRVYRDADQHRREEHSEEEREWYDLDDIWNSREENLEEREAEERWDRDQREVETDRIYRQPNR